MTMIINCFKIPGMTQPDSDHRPHPDLIGLSIPEPIEDTIGTDKLDRFEEMNRNSLQGHFRGWFFVQGAYGKAEASTSAKDDEEGLGAWHRLPPIEPNEIVLLES